MSQPQALSVETNASNARASAAASRPSGNGPRVANAVDAPVASPVHSLHDRLVGLDDWNANADLAYSFKAHKAPAWVRMASPVVLSIVLWAGILYTVGLIG